MSLIPVLRRSPYRAVYHCCTWKSASQWVRHVLSDIAVYRYSGLKPVSFRTERDLEPFMNGTLKIENASVVTPVYATYDQLLNQFDPNTDRAFFVMRDPRDLIVSRYYSRVSAHPRNSLIDQHRAELKAMSLEDGLRKTMDDSETLFQILQSWARVAEDASVLLTRYEDLTGDNQESEWQRVLTHCGIDVPETTLRKLLRNYSFERMSGGRKKGEENPEQKYRKGVAGDWKNYFTPIVQEHFDQIAGNLIGELGYA